MKTILFNEEKVPAVGDVFVVKEVYTFEDGMYGPRVAVVLEPKDSELMEYAKKHLLSHIKATR